MESKRRQTKVGKLLLGKAILKLPEVQWAGRHKLQTP